MEEGEFVSSCPRYIKWDKCGTRAPTRRREKVGEKFDVKLNASPEAPAPALADNAPLGYN